MAHPPSPRDTADLVDATVAGLMEALADRAFDAAKLNRLSERCEALRHDLDLDTRLAVVERLERDAPTSDTIRLRSILFLLTGDLYHYERILHYLQLGADSVDPALMHYALWGMMRQMFLGAASGERAANFVVCDLFRFYTALVRQVARRWSLVPPRASLREGPIRRVAVVTNQFTNHKHQPTRDCFDFAARLQDDFGLEVAVINVNGLPAMVEALFIPPFIAEVAETLEGVVVTSMFGRRVRVASFTERRFSQVKLTTIVESIDGYDPDLIVAFGGSNIVADLFAEAGARPVVCIPTTSGVTVSLAPIVLGYEEQDHTQAIPALYRPPFARRFRPFNFGWSLPPTAGGVVDTGFPEGTILFAVVGNRLDLEVSADFLALLDDLLDRCPGAAVLFAGGVDKLPGRLASRRNGARMRSLGHVGDIRAFYRGCHVFLNPTRQGGGGGTAFALAEGVPVVTPAYGDGASVAGPDFQVADRAAFLDRAAALAGDAQARATASALARARFAVIGDRHRCVERLLAYGEEARGILRAGRAH